MFLERFSLKVDEESCVTWLWLVYPVDAFCFSLSFFGVVRIGLGCRAQCPELFPHEGAECAEDSESSKLGSAGRADELAISAKYTKMIECSTWKGAKQGGRN